MGIKITSKAPCNTIGFLTNKGEKPAILKIDTSRIAKRYEDIGIVILKPDIDRITFGFSPTSAFLAKYGVAHEVDEYKGFIKSSLFHEGKYSELDLESGVPVKGVTLVKGVSFKKQPYNAYKVNVRYKPPSGTESILIQIGPKNESPNASFMRFDMNPSRFNKQAMKEFRKFIESLLVLPGVSIPYEDFLMGSKIFRADVCVDVLGARPYDLEIIPLANKKPTPSKSVKYKSKTGRTETVYHKAKKAGSNTDYVYDKRQERIDKGVEPVYGDFLHSRYECRVQKTTFHKLANIKNRCGRVSVRALDTNKFSKMKHPEKLFVRYALERSLSKALELIPDKLQAKFKKSYQDALRDIWDPKVLWSHWKKTVATSGFFPLEK